MERTLVLNASDEPLCLLPRRRAAVLVMADKADALAESDERLRSESTEVRCPAVIRLRRYVHIPYRHLSRGPNLVGLVARDGHGCAYCRVRAASTVDHVLPRSRGGAHSWENTVGACERCNAKKAARTPREAGMDLAFVPLRPPGRIWLSLATTRWDPAWVPFLADQGYQPGI